MNVLSETSIKLREKGLDYWKIQWCFICKLKSTDNISYTVKIIDNNYKSYHTVQEISTIIAVMCYHLILYMKTQYLWMIAGSEATREGPSLRSPPGDEITPLLGAALTFHTTGMSWCKEETQTWSIIWGYWWLSIMYITKSGNEGPTCALLLRQNIVQNYCNKSSFCYLCLTSSCSGNSLNNNQISMWIWWTEGLGGFFSPIASH